MNEFHDLFFKERKKIVVMTINIDTRKLIVYVTLVRRSTSLYVWTDYQPCVKGTNITPVENVPFI